MFYSLSQEYSLRPTYYIEMSPSKTGVIIFVGYINAMTEQSSFSLHVANVHFCLAVQKFKFYKILLIIEFRFNFQKLNVSKRFYIPTCYSTCQIFKMFFLVEFLLLDVCDILYRILTVSYTHLYFLWKTITAANSNIIKQFFAYCPLSLIHI